MDLNRPSFCSRHLDYANNLGSTVLDHFIPEPGSDGSWSSVAGASVVDLYFFVLLCIRFDGDL